MNDLQVTVATAQFADLSIERDIAHAHGVRVRFANGSSPKELISAGIGSAGVIITTEVVTREVLQAWAPTVRVLCRAGAGLDNVDLAAAEELGISVFNVPDYCTEEVATHALSLALMANRRLLACQHLAREAPWSQLRELLGPIKPLSDSTIGVVGLGQIGRRLATMARPLFGQVTFFDPYASVVPDGVNSVDSLENLFALCDIVSLHTPLSTSTHHLVNSGVLAHCKPGLALVNVARGGLVDTQALLAALDSGAVSFFATDVLEVEPPVPGDPLMHHPSVLVTGHTAWVSTQAVPRLRELSMLRLCDSLQAPSPTDLSDPS